MKYIQRSYYQPVTCYSQKTYYEPVTTYRTSYYYEPVCSYRYSCYYDPCSCSYQQVATPVTSYVMRQQCCPVTSYLQRCCMVPTTSYRQVCYWEAVPTCSPCPTCPSCPTCNGSSCDGQPHNGGAPAVDESRIPPGGGGPPAVDESRKPFDPSRQYPADPMNPATGRQNAKQPLRARPVAPTPPPPPPPAVKLDRIVSAPATPGVTGQVLKANRTAASGAKVSFVNEAKTADRQTVTAGTDGQFTVSLASGSWLVYVHDGKGQMQFHSKVDVKGSETKLMTLVSR
jgi:hypothetical protein